MFYTMAIYWHMTILEHHVIFSIIHFCHICCAILLQVNATHIHFGGLTSAAVKLCALSVANGTTPSGVRFQALFNPFSAFSTVIIQVR